MVVVKDGEGDGGGVEGSGWPRLRQVVARAMGNNDSG